MSETEKAAPPNAVAMHADFDGDDGYRIVVLFTDGSLREWRFFGAPRHEYGWAELAPSPFAPPFSTPPLPPQDPAAAADRLGRRMGV